MYSDNYYKLIDRECLLISNCFASGLTSLRKANLNLKTLDTILVN